MNKFLLLFFLLFLMIGCNKPKAVYICGDRKCINKAEAKQFFEENLSLEVRILDKKQKKEINLVQLNLEKNLNKKKINIVKKNNVKKKLKVLSKKEIKEIKSNIKRKNKDSIIKKKKVKKNIQTKIAKTNKTEINVKKEDKLKTNAIYSNKNNKQIVDVCTILKKCSIEEISEYLIKEGKDKDFPDITLR